MLAAAPFVILPLCNAVLQLLNTWLEHGLGGVFALIGLAFAAKFLVELLPARS